MLEPEERQGLLWLILVVLIVAALWGFVVWHGARTAPPRFSSRIQGRTLQPIS